MKIEDAFCSIEDLWLYNFSQYRKTQDMNWFIDGYNGRQTKLDEKLLIPIRDKMMADYYAETNDKSVSDLISKYEKIQKLETSYVVVLSLIDRFMLGFGADIEHQEIRLKYIKELKKYRFTIPIINTQDEDVECCETIFNQIQGYKTGIKIILDTIPRDEKKAAKSLQEQLLQVEKQSGIGRKIDPKNTTLMEWIALIKSIK